MVGRTSILQRTVSFAFFVVSMKRRGGGSNVVWLGELRATASVGWAFRHFFGLHSAAQVESRHFFGLHSAAQVESRHFFWPSLRGSGWQHWDVSPGGAVYREISLLRVNLFRFHESNPGSPQSNWITSEFNLTLWDGAGNRKEIHPHKTLIEIKRGCS